MNEKDWLDAATVKIRFRPDREAVRRELEAHLEDKWEASGAEVEAAVEAMGDPTEIAEELGRLHRPWLGYLWRMSQLALAGAAVTYCLLVVLLALRPNGYWLLPGRALYHSVPVECPDEAGQPMTCTAYAAVRPPEDAAGAVLTLHIDGGDHVAAGIREGAFFLFYASPEPDENGVVMGDNWHFLSELIRTGIFRSGWR